MSYSRPFDDPVPGLRTLRDAANHIMNLPKAERELPHWQAAAEALMLVAELDGPVMFARIGMLRAMNHGKKPEPRRKQARKYRIVR
jgi:hypothetical protein